MRERKCAVIPPRACLPLQCPGHMTELTALCTIRHSQIREGGILETIPALGGYASVWICIAHGMME